MAYSPAGNSTSSPGLAHLQAIFYNKTGLDVLQKNFVFRSATEKDKLPLRSGRTAQWFRYNNLSAGTTPATEGSVGTSLQTTSNVVGATVSQYANFISVSDFLMDTAIDPIVESNSERLGYRAGLSVDTITRNVIDAESGAAQTALATYLGVDDLRAARTNLAANDVMPFDDGEYFAVAHPFATFDLVNDPAAGGLADIFKYTTPKATALVSYPTRGTTMASVAGCRVVESTNTYQGTGPNTYRVYVFGKGGVGSLDLEGRGPSNVTDPNKQKFKISVIRNQGGNIADPEGMIGAAVAYNFSFASVVLQGPASIPGPYRYRYIDVQSTLG
jgi:N4-gp56 family major capsid protein